jgi:hypothetical protein
MRSIISEVSNLSEDVLDDLQKIIKKSREFLKLCGPIGALIAAGLNGRIDVRIKQFLPFLS